MQKTREPQYKVQLDVLSERGRAALGLTANATYHLGPRRLVFLLARYKFVAKMLSGKRRVLEVGCGDAFGTRIVLQEVIKLCAIDFDPVYVNDVNERMDEQWVFECRQHDILAGPVELKAFDAAYSLDVLEHIAASAEDVYLANICASLTEDGVFVVGTPSIQSQAYASEGSKEGHINCKDGGELKMLLGRYFKNVFIFSMNDEVVHTGFHPMAHYLFGLCAGVKC